MNFLKNQDKHLRVEEFLKDQIKKRGYNWNTAKMKPMDGEMYANAKIGGSGTEDLLDGNTNEVRGITNFNGNTLVKERIFVADGIAFGWAVADSDSNVASVTYNYNTITDYLRHANIVMKQKDEVILKLPLGAINNATGKSTDSVYRDLGSFALIEDEAVITYQIEFPQGVSAPLVAGKSLFVSAYLRGTETFLKR